MMKNIVMMSEIERGMILMCLYGLFLVQFGCNLAGLSRKERYWNIPGMVLLLITGSDLMVFRDIHEKLLSEKRIGYQMQVWMIGLILLFLSGRSGIQSNITAVR